MVSVGFISNIEIYNLFGYFLLVLGAKLILNLQNYCSPLFTINFFIYALENANFLSQLDYTWHGE